MTPQSQMETFMETQFPVCFHADTQTENPPIKGFSSLRVIFQTWKWKLILFLRVSFQFPPRDASVRALLRRFSVAAKLHKLAGRLNVTQKYLADNRMNSRSKQRVNEL